MHAEEDDNGLGSSTMTNRLLMFGMAEMTGLKCQNDDSFTVISRLNGILRGSNGMRAGCYGMKGGGTENKTLK